MNTYKELLQEGLEKMEEYDITFAQMAELIGVSKQCFYAYKKRNIMPADVFIKFLEVVGILPKLLQLKEPW